MKENGLHFATSLPSKTSSHNFHPDFVQERIQIANIWFYEICAAMPDIVVNEALLYGFAKFAGPVQYGDVRPQGFVMPFPL